MRRTFKNIAFAALLAFLTTTQLISQKLVSLSIDNQAKIEKIFGFLIAHPTQKGRQTAIYVQRIITEVDQYLQKNLVKYKTEQELRQFLFFMKNNKYVYDPVDNATKVAYKMAADQYLGARYNSTVQAASEGAYINFIEEFRYSAPVQADEVTTLLLQLRVRRALDARDFATATKLIKARIQTNGDPRRAFDQVDDLVARKLNGNNDPDSVTQLISFMESNTVRGIQMPSLDRARIQYQQIKYNTAREQNNEAAIIAFLAEFGDYKSSGAASIMKTARDQLTKTATARIVAEGESSMLAALASRTPGYANFGQLYDLIAESRYKKLSAGYLDDYDVFLSTYQNKQETLNGSDRVKSLVSSAIAARRAKVNADAQSYSQGMVLAEAAIKRYFDNKFKTR